MRARRQHLLDKGSTEKDAGDHIFQKIQPDMVFGESALLLKYQIVAGARPRQSNLAHASNGKGLLLAAVCQALHARSYSHGRRLLRSYDIHRLHGTAFPSPRTFDIGRGVTMNCYRFLCHVTLAPGTVAMYGHWEVHLANTSFVGKTMKVMPGSTCFRWKSDVKWRPVQTAATP